MAPITSGMVKSTPTKSAMMPSIVMIMPRIATKKTRNHYFDTTRRLTSIAVQGPRFLSITRPTVNIQQTER